MNRGVQPTRLRQCVKTHAADSHSEHHLLAAALPAARSRNPSTAAATPAAVTAAPSPASGCRSCSTTGTQKEFPMSACRCDADSEGAAVCPRGIPIRRSCTDTGLSTNRSEEHPTSAVRCIVLRAHLLFRRQRPQCRPPTLANIPHHVPLRVHRADDAARLAVVAQPGLVRRPGLQHLREGRQQQQELRERLP